MLEIVNSHNVLVRKLKTAARLAFQVVEQCTVMYKPLRKEFQRHVALQFFITRQPDNSHPPLPQNINQRIAAEESLSDGKLTLRHLRRAASLLSAHAVRILLEETAIK